jgi:outer membrane biosynthesis protein TonB
MESQQETKLEQTAPEEGAAAIASPEPLKKASKKKASKKKASKKKASKKKASKKKASKKKASKKKASKKKASKKKASRKGPSEQMVRVLNAADDLREALQFMAAEQLAQRRQAVEDLRNSAREKFSDLEASAQSSLARLLGKG